MTTIGCVALTGLTGFTRSKPRAKALGIHAPTIKALKGRHRSQGVGPTGVNRIAGSKQKYLKFRISNKEFRTAEFRHSLFDILRFNSTFPKVNRDRIQRVRIYKIGVLANILQMAWMLARMLRDLLKKFALQLCYFRKPHSQVTRPGPRNARWKPGTKMMWFSARPQHLLG